jgi:N-acetylglucosaminyldiphosphoundecaprenol N-acetyl-beta-D-mannosaminyltransferase
MNAFPQHGQAFDSGHSHLRVGRVDRVGVGYALIDNCSGQEACAAIIAHAKSRGKSAFVTTANAQHIVLLERDKRLRNIYDRADLVVPDGISLLLAARVYGRCLRERIAGVDMFQMLCSLAAENNLRVFLLGGRPNSADLTAAVLKQRFPDLRISSYCPPLGFEQTAVGLERTAQAVCAAKPDLIFVAFGAPKQEYWIYEHGLRLAVPIYIGVGGSFEMVAGVVRRAPEWIQHLGCEWAYRFCLEPRRLWRRYLIGNLQFAVIVARQQIRRTFLDTFLKFVEDDKFGAELYEPRHQEKLKRAAGITNFDSRDGGYDCYGMAHQNSEQA